MDFFNDHVVAFALVCAAVAIGFGIGFTIWLLRQPPGDERMQEIGRAIQEGAAAYLRRQYMTIAAVAVVPFLALGLYSELGWGTAIGFLVGATFSAAAGFVGMNVAVRSNMRTAEAAKSGLRPALNVAFRAGSVTGLLVVGLGLLGVAGYYYVLTGLLDNSQESAIRDLIGLAFGGSLISVFARLGGGIYTKAADVGA
ncbi:MAG: sodium/proton-translocating pyrophosphatase, partial [Actinobacteria bacterium]|nr:sodium/proton-translocating pyrophosphatase [Actinomycetota bacterium]